MRTPKHIRIALLLVLVLGLAAFSADFSGTVVGITDGDTIDVLRNRRQIRVRLHGIDAPERGQAFSERAHQFTAQLAFRKTVTIRVLDTDRYGRTVAEVILADGRILNHELVKAGFAWWYRDYAPNDHNLRLLEEDARRNRLGLWQHKEPIPPWSWRRRGR